MITEPPLPGAKQQSDLNLEARAAAVGEALAKQISEVLDAIPSVPRGPAELARTIGIDKVLASRVLKAAQSRDPVAVLHLMPGPEPLRRLLRAAASRGVPQRLIANAEIAVAEFDALVRHEVGDRSALQTLISGWLPEARQEFELRRKQSAYRAMSELLGIGAATNLATVFLHPTDDGEKLDVVWLFGLLGLQRLRPGGRVKFASRRIGKEQPPRLPQTLDGVKVEGMDGLRLAEFCSKPSVPLDVHHAGEVVHYTFAGMGLGPRSATDIVFAEVNRAELDRYVSPEERPQRQVFAEVSVPVKVMVFDALLHEDVFSGIEPSLHLYDTTFDGVADVNDRGRDIDRLDLSESIQPLGRGIASCRAAEIPRYAELLRHVCGKLAWDADRFRAYRCRIDYPLYGTQVLFAYDSLPRPSA